MADSPEYADLLEASADMLNDELPERVQGVVVLAFEKDTFGYALRGVGPADAAQALRDIAELIEKDIH